MPVLQEDKKYGDRYAILITLVGWLCAARDSRR